MVLAAFILLTLVVGWFVPQILVQHLPGGMAVLLASVITLALGAGAVWIGAQTVGALGFEDAQSAFDRGFNAWKFMLLLAPASALHAQKQLTKETS